jgi:hypothetical protein
MEDERDGFRTSKRHCISTAPTITSLPTEPATLPQDPRQFQGHPRDADPYNGASNADFGNYVSVNRSRT